MEKAKVKSFADTWICLSCKSSRKDYHTTLDDGKTPCPEIARLRAKTLSTTKLKKD